MSAFPSFSTYCVGRSLGIERGPSGTQARLFTTWTISFTVKSEEITFQFLHVINDSSTYNLNELHYNLVLMLQIALGVGTTIF